METDIQRLIATTALRGLTAIGSGERPLHAADAQLREAVTRQIDAAAARLFAQPVTDAKRSEIDWYSTCDGPIRRFDALNGDEQAAVLAALDRRLQALAAAADRLRGDGEGASHLATLIDRALLVPDENAIWLIGDQPVLVCWGFRHDKAVDALDLKQFIDRVRSRQPPPPPEPEPEPETDPAPPPASPPPVRPVGNGGRWIAAGLAGLVIVVGGGLYFFMRNHPPTAVDDQATTDFSTPVDIDVLANDSDPDGDPLRVAISSALEMRGKLEVLPDNRIRYIPPDKFHGVEIFGYTIDDGRDGAASAKVTVTIPNRVPVFSVRPPITVAYETPTVIDFSAAVDDPNGDPLILRDASATTGVPEILPGLKVRYVPAAGRSGADEIAFTIDDGHGGTVAARQPVIVGADPCARKEFTYNSYGAYRLENPAACRYEVTIRGAGGGGGWAVEGNAGTGGNGGMVRFSFIAAKRGTFDILVGQGGSAKSQLRTEGGGGGGGVNPDRTKHSGGSGGGASAVAYDGTPLAIAGGGGGGGSGGRSACVTPGGALGGGNGESGFRKAGESGKKAEYVGGAGGLGALLQPDGRGGKGGSPVCGGSNNTGSGGTSTPTDQQPGQPGPVCSNTVPGEGGNSSALFRISGGGGSYAYPSVDAGGGGGGGYGGGGGGLYNHCAGTGGGGGGSMLDFLRIKTLPLHGEPAPGGKPNAAGADGSVVLVRMPAR